MTTPRRLAANRANAQKSTGPRTPEGKARSRRNALKHGAVSRAIVPPALAPFESRADFDELRAALAGDLQPASPLEDLILELIAINCWRLVRVARSEAGSIARSRIFVAQHALSTSPTQALTTRPTAASPALTPLLADLDRLIADLSPRTAPPLHPLRQAPAPAAQPRNAPTTWPSSPCAPCPSALPGRPSPATTPNTGASSTAGSSPSSASSAAARAKTFPHPSTSPSPSPTVPPAPTRPPELARERSQTLSYQAKPLHRRTLPTERTRTHRTEPRVPWRRGEAFGDASCNGRAGLQPNASPAPRAPPQSTSHIGTQSLRCGGTVGGHTAAGEVHSPRRTTV